MSYKVMLRRDQGEFVISALEFIMDRCNEQDSTVKCDAFRNFTAARTAERAVEIRDMIRDALE